MMKIVIFLINSLNGDAECSVCSADISTTTIITTTVIYKRLRRAWGLRVASAPR